MTRSRLGIAPLLITGGCGPTGACERLDGPAPAVFEEVSGRVIPEPDDDAASLFDRTVLRTLSLELAAQDLEALDADPAAEQYVPGALLFDGERLEPVGVRYSGSVGSWWNCLEEFTEEHGWHRRGRKTCPKLNLKVDVHEYDDDLRLRGLKKIALHAMNNDPSLMREQLGFAVFRQAGVAAPRTAHVRLVVNGVVQGVFLLVEEVDGRFTDAHFADGDGNVFRDAWPTGAGEHGVRPTEARLRAALETNEGEGTSVAAVLSIGEAIEGASGLERLDAVAAGFGVDHLARFLAVDRALGNDDGAVHLYCFDEGCRNHNVFLYQEVLEERLWLIPWDLDLAFVTGGLRSTDADRTVQLTRAWDDHDARCVPLPGGSDHALRQLPAACDPLLNAMSCGYADPVDRAGDALLDGPYRAEVVDAELDAWAALIADAVEEAWRLDDRQLSPDAWAEGLADLRRRVDVLRSRVKRR